MVLKFPPSAHCPPPKEDKRLHIIRKDVPIALIAQGISRVWRTVSQELWIKTKQIFLGSVIHQASIMATCLGAINHNNTVCNFVF